VNRLKPEKQESVISALVEGASVRSVERMTGVESFHPFPAEDSNSHGDARIERRVKVKRLRVQIRTLPSWSRSRSLTHSPLWPRHSSFGPSYSRRRLLSFVTWPPREAPRLWLQFRQAPTRLLGSFRPPWATGRM
jgi:hypothetical protein